MNKLTFHKLDKALIELAMDICTNHEQGRRKCYAIPRGGVPVALALKNGITGFTLVETPEEADFFVDDIIDSGATAQKYQAQFPNKPFYGLIDKTNPEHLEKYPGWIVFPWESTQENGLEDNVRRLLQCVGEDASREGLLETPARVAKAWLQTWASGYSKDPATILKVFEDGGESYTGAVTVKDIPIYSHCEHHLAPIFGTVTISYIPDGKIVGLSKLSRIADMYARRLQVQERLTDQIADALWEHLKPKGVGVQIKARHMCMESRGICQQGHHTVTTSLRGVMLSDALARSEFLSGVQ